MAKTVLILSNTGDAHTDFLVKSCARLGVTCFRLNTDMFRRAGQIDWTINQGEGVLRIDGRSCALKDVALLIYRRPVNVHEHRKDIEHWLGRLLDFEWTTVENALSLAVPGIVLNPVGASALARNKLAQLQAARKVGLAVPATLISNNIHELRAFLDRHRCITKAIDNAYNVTANVLRSSATSIVTAADFADYTTTDCPTLLQQAITPRAVWRIVTIADKAMGFRFSGDAILDHADSRHVDEKLACEYMPIPDGAGEKMVALCRAMGIVFASSDLIEDDTGRMWFIDLNPDGQWAYMQERCNVAIDDEIIKLAL